MTDSPAVDVLGNILPSGLVQQQQSPSLPIPSALPPQDETAQPQPQLAPGSFGQKFYDAASKLGVTPEPGSWARSLVGANVSALNKKETPAGQPQAGPGGWRGRIGGAVEEIGKSLGDAALGAGNLASGGALSGVIQTLHNRGKRIAEEKEAASKEKTQEALRAETMQRTVAAQRNMYRQSEEDRRAAQTRDLAYMNTFRKDYETTDNVTQSQLNDLAKKDPDFWKKYRGRATGEEPVMDGDGNPVKDKDGNITHSPLYTISSTQSKSGGDVTHEVTANDSAYFKKYLNKDIPAGTKMTSDMYDAAHAM